MTAEDIPDPRGLLAWYAEMGVDIALADAPVDRFASPSGVAGKTAAPVHDTLPPAATFPSRDSMRMPLAAPAVIPAAQAPTPPAVAERAAQDAAKAATTLDELRAALLRFAPGRDEDIQGLPFVGRSGQLLNRMLAAIGLDRRSVYIANVVPWRPPGNRTPTPQETALCRPFIMRQIELCDPDFLICMGAPSAAELMGNTQGILKFRGQWRAFDTGTRTIRAMATLHPAYLLRQPLQKRLAWRDFLQLQEALAAN
jgi:DNA polymerase